MMRFTTVLACCLLPALAFAGNPPWQHLETLGTARLNFFLWPVYDATLYGPAGEFEFPVTRPFALALEYHRRFSGSDLVRETRRQWQSQGTAYDEAWLSRLNGILTDVAEGDVVSLYVDEQGASHFYYNGQYLGGIGDPVFSERFAAIWLAETTTQPGFRDRLLATGRREQ